MYVTARAFLAKLSQSYKLQPGHLIRHGWIYCLIFISKPICSTVNAVGGSPPELKGRGVAFNSVTLENIIQLSDASVLFWHCKTYQTSLRGNISIRASTKVADLYSLPYMKRSIFHAERSTSEEKREVVFMWFIWACVVRERQDGCDVFNLHLPLQKNHTIRRR